MDETQPPDPEVYGTEWRAMAEAPKDGHSYLLLLIPSRPGRKVIGAI